MENLNRMRYGIKRAIPLLLALCLCACSRQVAVRTDAEPHIGWWVAVEPTQVTMPVFQLTNEDTCWLQMDNGHILVGNYTFENGVLTLVCDTAQWELEAKIPADEWVLTEGSTDMCFVKSATKPVISDTELLPFYKQLTRSSWILQGTEFSFQFLPANRLLLRNRQEMYDLRYEILEDTLILHWPEGDMVYTLQVGGGFCRLLDETGLQGILQPDFGQGRSIPPSILVANLPSNTPPPSPTPPPPDLDFDLLLGRWIHEETNSSYAFGENGGSLSTYDGLHMSFTTEIMGHMLLLIMENGNIVSYDAWFIDSDTLILASGGIELECKRQK